MSAFDSHAQPIETRLAQIGVDGRVTAEEVLFLRRQVFADGVVSERELDAIFALGDRAPDGDPEWPQFFAEAVADFYLREEEPQGYLTEDEFDELQARISRNNHANALERLLLVKLMESAVQTPKDMSRYTGREIKAAIIAKDIPAVDKDDVMLIRRWLFAAGGDGYVGVTKEEAEVLFDINDALRVGEPSAAWSELFVQGVVNHLMASLGYSAADRQEAIRRHAFISDHSANVGGFFQKMLSGVAGAFGSAEDKSVYEQKAEARDAAVAEAEKITPAESEWLATRIGRDGAFDENERLLIERMKEFEADLPAELKVLLERAA
jgi:hypothetical protein